MMEMFVGENRRERKVQTNEMEKKFCSGIYDTVCGLGRAERNGSVSCGCCDSMDPYMDPGAEVNNVVRHAIAFVPDLHYIYRASYREPD